MATSNRERQLDVIRQTSDRLTELARRYDRLRWMAEKPIASDAFINLATAAGEMTTASLEQCSTLLEIMFNTQQKVDGTP
jgi:hypothetical protein